MSAALPAHFKISSETVLIYNEGFLDGEEGSNEWNEANNINYEWGLDIATNINELLSGERQIDFY
mgnify:CR=1 FL=1